MGQSAGVFFVWQLDRARLVLRGVADLPRTTLGGISAVRDSSGSGLHDDFEEPGGLPARICHWQIGRLESCICFPLSQIVFGGLQAPNPRGQMSDLF